MNKLVTGGYAFSVLGSLTLLSSAISGVVGPVVMGVAAAPVLGKVMVAAGLTAMGVGIYREYKVLREVDTEIKEMVENIKSSLGKKEEVKVSSAVEDILAGLDIPMPTDDDLVIPC